MQRITPIACLLVAALAMIPLTQASALPTDPVTQKLGRWCDGADPPIAYTEGICARLHRAKLERRAERLAARQAALAPAPAPAPVPTASPVTVAPAPVGGSGCVGMEAESGSTGYATDTGNGYIGCYQISADHFTTGSCAGLGTDPAGQDACASIICDTEGAGAWTNPSGENPCGRL